MRPHVSALAIVLGLALAATPAVAEVGTPTPTVQAVAADATWLAYAPAPAHSGVVCMVDSGVDPNPDTETAVIGGQAIASETDTLDEIARLEPRVQPGNHPDGHGTLMAMMMAAPVNGWGMVGIAPTSVRIYNMKALPKGQTTFPFNYYAVAIKECQQIQSGPEPFVSVINLSLGGTSSPQGTELTALENYVVSAHRNNLSVVAAAGNENGPVIYPAAYRPILAVGAGEVSPNSGGLCPFSARGEGLDVVAPGCDGQLGGLQGAFEDDGSPAVGSGSSQASALVSAALASMRAYAPGLTFAHTEECLTSTTKSGVIDVAAAFEACGLSQVVNEGKSAEGVALRSQQAANPAIRRGVNEAVSLSCRPSSCTPSPEPLTRGLTKYCPRPRLGGIVRQGSWLILSMRGRSNGCRLQARWRVKRGTHVGWTLVKTGPSDGLRLAAKERLQGLKIRYVGRVDQLASQWVAVRIPRRH